MSADAGESPAPGATEFSPEEVERLRRVDLENIRARAMAGKTLTADQLARLEAANQGQGTLPFPPAADAVYVGSQQLLAEALGLSDRKTVQRWLKEGAPPATDDGRYNVTDWRLWMQQHNRGARKKDDPESIKTQIALTELKRKQIELAELEGTKLDLDETVDVCSEMWSRFARALEQMKHNLAPAVVGETVPEATKRIGAAVHEVLTSLSVPPGAKKKAFWRNVSAKLSDLQRTYLPSPTPRSTSPSTTDSSAIPT